jgi:hypothetical protein
MRSISNFKPAEFDGDDAAFGPAQLFTDLNLYHGQEHYFMIYIGKKTSSMLDPAGLPSTSMMTSNLDTFPHLSAGPLGAVETTTMDVPRTPSWIPVYAA